MSNTPGPAELDVASSPRRSALKRFLTLGLVLLAALLLLIVALRATDVVALGPAIDARPLLGSIASFVRGVQWSIVIFFLAISVLLAIPPAWARWQERRGRRELTAWARVRGWTVHPVGVEAAWTDRLPGRAQDGAWRVAVLVTGQHASRSTSVALCSRTESAQSYAEGHHITVTLVSLRTVLVVRMPRAFPSVRIVRRRLGSKVWHASRSPGSVEPSGAEFARRFRVSTQDPESVWIGPALAPTLKAGDVRWLDLDGHDLVMSWRGLANPARIAAGLDAICSVADLVERPPPPVERPPPPVERPPPPVERPPPPVAAHGRLPAVAVRSLPPPPAPEGQQRRMRPPWPGGRKALVLGTLGLLICWVPIVGLPLPVLGLVFGIPNIGPPARGKAILGIVISSMGLLINFVITYALAIVLVSPSS
jgi:hypothetical protein